VLQHGKPICFHYETFNGVMINYPTYDKELYALVLSVKKWKHYVEIMQLQSVFLLLSNILFIGSIPIMD
jgi:hypothetical protein